MTSLVPARPAQAVVLAGGRGSRLRPLTDHRPKPMIEFHGRPFLEYVVELLAAQGFSRILMLLGYLPDVITQHFGDGRRFGVEIEYAVTGVEDETGQRLRDAETLLDPVFMLLYCDNIWPLSFDRLWQHFVSKDALVQVTAYRNADKYTRDNLAIDADGFVSTYDKSRTKPGLAGVDIGFFIVRREALRLLPPGNRSFEAEVLPRLVANRQLCAFVSDHRYYSVGSHERLRLTEAYLRRDQTVFLDRDGVLNRKPIRARYVRDWSEWEWLPGATDALRLWKEAGYRVILISNQAGIARGAMTQADLAEIHRRMTQEARAAGGDIDEIFYCPHGWDDGCECRKPKPGMLLQAQRQLHLDLSRTWFIGDDERDGQAAAAAGCPSILTSDSRGLLQVTTELLRTGDRT